MSTLQKYLTILIVFITTGCASVSTVGRSNGYYDGVTQADNNEPLFGTTVGTLSDKDIKKILNYQVKLPMKNCIAILNLSNNRYWQNYSSDFTQLNQSMADNFIVQLRGSPRVYDASFLPGMLVPGKRTVSFLREAAAQYQADLLLAYRSSCRTFQKYRLVKPDETKAYCLVEAVLLDVRSGIVPFTILSSNEFSAKKEKEDVNFNETIKKAEMVAVAKSLKETASRLNLFLDDVAILGGIVP